MIIPTYYRYGCLGNLIDSLSKQSFPAHEVIVADQTPVEDRDPEFYNKLPRNIPLQVLYIKTPSLSIPRNRAAEVATGDYLLFLDDDLSIRENLIESHIQVMKREGVDAVTGAVSLNSTLPEEFPWDISKMDPVRFFLAAPNCRWNGMMISVSSGNFSIKRHWFLKANGFDENLPRMVDFEFGYRLFRSGAKIYYSHEPFAQHLRAPGGSRKNPHNHNRLVAALYIHKKHFPGWMTTQFVLKILIGPYFQRWTLKTPFKIVVWAYRLMRASAKVKKILIQPQHVEQFAADFLGYKGTGSKDLVKKQVA